MRVTIDLDDAQIEEGESWAELIDTIPAAELSKVQVTVYGYALDGKILGFEDEPTRREPNIQAIIDLADEIADSVPGEVSAPWAPIRTALVRLRDEEV